MQNIGQIVTAQHRKDGEEDTFVSVISISNCVGRLGKMARQPPHHSSPATTTLLSSNHHTTHFYCP
jgi:hypothetical protein